MWAEQVGNQARLMDPAAAVARQLQRVLAAADLLSHAAAVPERLHLVSTGDLAQLEAAARRWVLNAPDGAAIGS